MEFLPIFAREESVFWSVCFPEDGGEDSFRKFINQIYNYHFLTDFFKLNKPLLSTSFWNNISTQTAYLQVLEEADDLEQELKCFEIGGADCVELPPRKIFEPLDKDIYLLQSRNKGFRKARPHPDNFNKPMLRIYAVELDDGTMVITGGVIKLTLKMEGVYMENALRKLSRVRDYLRSHQITSREGLI